ncbi:hypothetical protein [Polaromonas sp. SM01]|uniref:hypothetical protein n=1 Tax=Polaromonas sp. SM01 TaxID=3085630 RepID=UPI002981EE25|nr:hypothetical protein [Polaromonas sp. SM01]MDW5441764.1 hypothetical protein [Polaromonas sp. SM01]
MFFLSLLWRISVSTHPNYSNIDLPFPWEEEMRHALQHETYLSENKFTVTLRKLHDPTPDGGFSNENLRSLIFSPFGRKYERFISVGYPFLGFFVEVFLPKIPKEYSKRANVLHGKNPVFFAPFVDVLSIPEIMNSLVQGLRKHNKGISKVN